MATKYSLVLISYPWKSSKKVTVKMTSEDKKVLEVEYDRLQSIADRTGHSPRYKILGPIQLKKLMAEVKAEQTAARKNGAKKAAETRKKNGPNFICCPQCGAKSKKLYSEFGGLQTRKCQNGHTFEYDKWIADRAFWGGIVTPRLPKV
jgi:uncharacterized C2H2 Zn-finger protein